MKIWDSLLFFSIFVFVMSMTMLFIVLNIFSTFGNEIIDGFHLHDSDIRRADRMERTFGKFIFVIIIDAMIAMYSLCEILANF